MRMPKKARSSNFSTSGIFRRLKYSTQAGLPSSRSSDSRPPQHVQFWVCIPADPWSRWSPMTSRSHRCNRQKGRNKNWATGPVPAGHQCGSNLGSTQLVKHRWVGMVGLHQHAKLAAKKTVRKSLTTEKNIQYHPGYHLVYRYIVQYIVLHPASSSKIGHPKHQRSSGIKVCAASCLKLWIKLCTSTCFFVLKIGFTPRRLAIEIERNDD